MTACVNKKSKRVAAVVTASLVGALSIGAPAVALATGSGDIEMLAADWFTDATVSKAVDNMGNTVTSPDKATFTLGSGKYLVPTEVKNSYVTTDVDTDDFKLTYSQVKVHNSGDDGYAPGNTEYTGLVENWEYKTAENGTPFTYHKADGLTSEQAAAYFSGKLLGSKDETIKVEDGAYTVKVSNVNNASESVSATFKVTDGTAAEGVYAYVGSDSSVKDIVYNGTDLEDSIKFADADGTDITAKVTDKKFYLADGTEVGTKVDSGTTHVKAAGSYIASFTYKGASYNVSFTVSPLDLSKATLYVADTKDDLSNTFLSTLKVNDVTMPDGDLAISAISGPNGTNQLSALGEFTVTVSDADPADGNVTGSGKVTFSHISKNVYTDLSGKVKYGTKQMASDAIWAVSLLDGESFDASKVSVEVGDATYKGDQLEVTFFKRDKDTKGAKVAASDLANAGDYFMSVRVKPIDDWANDQLLGGTQDIKITVTGSTLSTSKNLAFYIDGELSGDDKHLTYDGTDLLKRLEVVVKDGSKTYELGTNYTLEVKCDGKAVTEAVDHGDYEVTVKPLTFKWNDSSNKFTLHVDQVELNTLIAASQTTKYSAEKNGQLTNKGDQEYYVPFTGKAVAIPGVKYEVANEKQTEFKYVDLDSKLYNVVNVKQGGAVVKEAIEAGKTYTVKIALTDAAAKNYKLADNEFEFTIKEFGHFTDVDSAEWYSVPVEKAYEEGYINGISGTNLFAPKADITRADAVCILFNMAGGVIGNSDFSYNENTGYETGFSDVDGHAYFAKALAWAKASGVANGSNGQFRPYDKITREEFVSLLANFAKSKGDYEAVDADEVLGSATDYTGWAKENVAWAKANGIMGNNGAALDGTGKITRAQVAAMAVNYQPENLTGYVRNDKGEMVKPTI